MEQVRSKLAVIRTMLDALDSLRGEWAQKRSQWEMMRTAGEGNPEDAGKLEIAKNQLGQHRTMIDSVEKRFVEVLGCITVEQARAKFVELANLYNIVSELEETLTKRQLYLSIITSSGTEPFDWDEATKGVYSPGIEADKNNELQKQVEAARKLLASVESQISIADPSSILLVKPSIQIVR